MKRLKKGIAICLMGAFLIGLVGCGAQSPSSSSTAKEEKMVPVRVGVLSIADSLPIFAAEQEKMFEAAGLDVKVFPFKSSSDQSKALEAGELDVVMNDMIVQSLVKKAGVDTKIVATAFGANPKEGRFVVVGAPNSGLKDPKDLVGKRVAISTNTMMEYLMNQYEHYYKIDPASVELVNMPNLMLRVETLLAGKDIDAAILPDPLASFAIAKGGVVVIDDTTLDENFSQSVFLATDSFLKDHKGTMDAFMEVLAKSMDDINKNPEKYRDLALSTAKVPENLKDAYEVPHFTPSVVPTQQEVARVQDWMVDHKLLDKVYSYKDLVTKQYVKA